MTKINPKSSSEDCFKLYYYHICFHPERISKLKQFENNYSLMTKW